MRELYPLEIHSSFHRDNYPYMSPKLEKLISYIPDECFDFVYYNYRNNENRTQFINYYGIEGVIDPHKNTLVFLAHHDVNNNSNGCENVVDNTGSLSILLALHNRIHGRELNCNVVFCYTDGEELANPTIAGSRRLAEQINNEEFGPFVQTINLEVSVHGKRKFVDMSNGIFYESTEFVHVDTPFSDSRVLNQYNVKSSCIGIMTEEDYDSYNEFGYCPTWDTCHTNKDKFELANEEDMNEFCTWLEKFVMGYE